MMPDIYVHILNLIETMLFCKHCKKTLELYPIPWCGNSLQAVSSCRSWGNSPENLWKLSSKRKSPQQEINQSVIYLSLSFNPGLHFSIKCVSYDSLKIFLCSRIAKKGIILKFPPLHVFIWHLTSVYCNSHFQTCCL